VKETDFTKMVNEVIELKLKAVDAYIEEIVEPLAEVGNPEKLMGKKYEEFTPQDLQMLAQVYGQNEPNPLSDLIFKKSYEEVKKLEEV